MYTSVMHEWHELRAVLTGDMWILRHFTPRWITNNDSILTLHHVWSKCQDGLHDGCETVGARSQLGLMRTSLMKEYRDLTADPIQEMITAGPLSEDNMLEWEALIQGPEGTPYVRLASVRV